MKIALPLLVLLLASAVSAQTVKPRPSLTVYDANGKKLGKPANGYPPDSFRGLAIAFKSNGKTFLLRVTRDRLKGNSENLFFESVDCSGTPLILPPSESNSPEWWLLTASVLVGPNQRLYLGDTSVAPQSRTFRSVRMSGDGTCLESIDTRDTLPVTDSLIDLAPRFSPPFSVR